MVASPRHPTADLKYWRYMQPGSQELRDIKAYYAAVIRGLVPGAMPFDAYGRVDSGAVLTSQDVWPGPTARQPYHPTGEALAVHSSSANDSAAGSGVQAVQIHYVKADGTLGSWDTDLAGVTLLPLPEDARFIECIHSTRGTLAAGDITIENGAAVVYSIIKTGDLRCSSSVRFIPVDKRFFMLHITGGSGSGTSASVTEFDLFSTELDSHTYIDQGLRIPHNGIVIQDNSLATELMFPVSPGQLVGGQYKTDKGALITFSYAGWLEDI